MPGQTTTANPLRALNALGQSVWLDDLHRDMLRDGSLIAMIERDGLSGLTSNPAILSAAILQHREYRRAAARLARSERGSPEIYEALVLQDIGEAADLFLPVYERTAGRDGFVSVEVSPHLAHDSRATIHEARRLWAQIMRPNVMIKVPATRQGLEAIQTLLAEGINVNVTLLFSVSRYREVAEAYVSALEWRGRRGKDVARVASVASFFLSRIDTHIDRILEARSPGDADAHALRGRAATACASVAYANYLDLVASVRWRELAQDGARTQRLLWASTSTKDARYSDIKYVEELVAADTVTTIPPATLEAYRDHGEPQLRLAAGQARNDEDVLQRLEQAGIDVEAIAGELERDGVRKFTEPFEHALRYIDATRSTARSS